MVGRVMNYAEIKTFDIANGVGVRTTLFVSGCRHRCRGCFNAEAWDFEAGEPFTQAVADEILHSLEPTYVTGLSILGGEPLEPENQEVLAPFLERVCTAAPDKTIWMWTGFTWDQLTREPSRARTQYLERILTCLDVLVDGPFVEAQKDLMLRFRGSANQRLLDVPASVATGMATEWHDIDLFSTHAW